MRFSNVLRCLAVSTLLSFFAPSANAAPYTFAVDFKAGTDFSFTLDSSPTPDFVNPGIAFGIFDVPTTIGTFSEIYFYSPVIGNGFTILDGNVSFLDTLSQLPFYAGPENAPHFLTGTYAFSNLFGDEIGSLTISAAVPEPSTWAMMILGFLGIGVMTFRRRKRPPAVAA
ncbi:MAG: PEP-CTERM sorting domain-containing protein [Rhizobiales bacterium]|nr:PEP-CTERM sorting domain-containing protein [Hyphomicrobiales bacterium]